MIRKMDINDNERILNFIKSEPEVNLYIKSDIDNYGYDKEFLEYFGELNDDNNLTAILVRFFSIFNVYAKGNYDVMGFANIIKSYDHLNMISGKSSVVSEFDKTDLKPKTIDKHYYAVLKEVNKDFKAYDNINIKEIKIDDIDRIVELRTCIKEFGQTDKDLREMLEQEYKTKTGKGYYVEADKRIVSYAQTSAENKTSAMVVSVMTDENYRGKGYASAIIKTLCEDRINDGKILCLYYKNPKAGEIYKKIGFKDISQWSMYRF